MKLQRNEDRMCNNCLDRKETRVFELTIGGNTTFCLCVHCLEELKLMIGELELPY